jgi:putative transposase
VPFASAHALFNLSRLAVWWLRVGIGSNGSALAILSRWPPRTDASDHEERNHQPAGLNFLQQQARFDDFVDIYNNERPHEALGMKYPAEFYQPSTRHYQGLPDIDYPFHDQIVVLTSCGRICLDRKKINFNTVFAGQAVGIKEVHDDIWLVSFMDYDLGYFDLETRVLEPLDDPFGPRLSPM